MRGNYLERCNASATRDEMHRYLVRRIFRRVSAMMKALDSIISTVGLLTVAAIALRCTTGHGPDSA